MVADEICGDEDQWSRLKFFTGQEAARMRYQVRRGHARQAVVDLDGWCKKCACTVGVTVTINYVPRLDQFGPGPVAELSTCDGCGSKVWVRSEH